MSYRAHIPLHAPFEAWREQAKRALSNGIPPHEIDWSDQGGLFSTEDLPPLNETYRLNVKKYFLTLAQSVLWHKDPTRAHLLYTTLWRLSRGEDALSLADPLGRALQLMAKSVSRDIHKAHAFVRFKEVAPEGPRRRFVAWFEPEHNIIEPASSFFAKRFADMDWLIASPLTCAYFTNGALTITDGIAEPIALPEDPTSPLWNTYYSNIFNPARIKLKAMSKEMPKKYWKNLPETNLIPALLMDAEARVLRMHEAGASTPRKCTERISTRYREKHAPHALKPGES